MTVFNFFDYLNNPIADFCVKNNKNVQIYTLDDMMDYIQKLPHSKRCLEEKRYVSIGNQLRLYLSKIQDDFLYVDADVFLPEESIDVIKSYDNCIYFNKKSHTMEAGTFFRANKDCEFIKFYLEKYTHCADERMLRKINIFHEFPYKMDLENMKSGDMNLIKPDIRHFYISSFYTFKRQFPNADTIRYTFDSNARKEGTYWLLASDVEDIKAFMNLKTCMYFFDTRNPHISQNTLFELWKEQLNFVYQKELKFEEI